MGAYTLEICYLFASICYILGLKMMAGPKTARNGNLLAAAGMTIAIFATIFLYRSTLKNNDGEILLDDNGKVIYKYLGNYI